MSVVNFSRGYRHPEDSAPIRMMNRSGGTRAIGDLVRLDNINTVQAETTDWDYQSDASAYYNVVLPSTAGLDCGIYGIVVDLLGNAGADNAELAIRTRGKMKALVSGTNAGVAGEPLMAVNAQDTLDSDAVTGSKVLGFLEAATAAGTAELVDILFDGVHGFGSSA